MRLAIPVTLMVALLGTVLSASSQAQTYPAKPVRIICPFPPGGATDIVTRLVAQKLNEAWGQQILVDNRGGAGGNIGGELAAKSPPDGYTLFMTSGSIVTANQHIYRKMPFNPEKDLVPITNVASGPQVLTIHPSFPAKSIKELIVLAKAKPGSMTFGSAGVGSQTHLAAENFLYAAAIDAVHIPYKGEGPALVDISAGRVDIFLGNISAALRFEKAGQIKFLGLAARTRSPVAPDVPSAPEIGLPDLLASAWFAIVAPPGTPDAVIRKINADTAAALKLPDVRTKFLDQGAEPVGQDPAATAAFIQDEERRWREVIKSANVTLE